MEYDAAADQAAWTNADRKVASWVIEKLRRWSGELDDLPSRAVAHTPEQRAKSDHLRKCPTLRVVSFHAADSLYGCGTCEYARVEGRVVCDHDQAGAEFSVGRFGELGTLFEDLARR